MTPQGTALGIVAVVVASTIAFALVGVRRLRVDPQEYIVGSRSFGAVLLWILLAGEIYTSFTFLGAAGWAYGKGAPAFYILAYGTVAYTIGYFLLPPLWRAGKQHGLLTLPDFFILRYRSKTLGGAIALLQFFLAVPYVTLQLTGLQILLTIAGYGKLNATVAVSVAFSAIALFVFTAGLRGAAWASVIKDCAVLLAVIFAGILLPIHFFGSPAAMVGRVLTLHPHWMTLQFGAAPQGEIWYISTVLLTSVGFFMGPANAPAIYSSRDENTLRRNMIFMPIYQLVLLLVFSAGFTALAVMPGLHGPAADQSFMLLLQHTYPAWAVGLVASAGALAALLPASGLLLGSASVVSENVLGGAKTWTTRALVLLVAALALVLWIFEKQTLVDLLLLYYNGITQLMPGVVFAFIWPRVNAWAVAAGIAGGEAVAFYLVHHSVELWGINPGFFALLVNVALCAIVAIAFSKKERPALAGP